MLTLLLIIFSSNFAAQPSVIIDDVFCIEINHIYQENEHGVATPRFSQVIFWEYKNGMLQVVDWTRYIRVDKKPRYNSSNKKWELFWLDGDYFRRVRATSYMETITSHDPEYENRTVLPINNRIGLGKVKK